MTHYQEIAKKILEVAEDPDRPRNGIIFGKIEAIEMLLRSYASDALNCLNDIHKTSLNAHDKEERILDMARKTGLIFRKSFH